MEQKIDTPSAKIQKDQQKDKDKKQFFKALF